MEKKKCCSLWLFEKSFQDFQKNVELKFGKKKSASDLFNEYIKNFNAQMLGVETDLKAKYEELKADYLRIKRKEDALYNGLNKDAELPGHLTWYEILVEFAVSLGTDANLVENIEEVYLKLQNYQCSDRDEFSSSHLEAFILFIETVLERRKVSNELAALRKADPTIGLRREANLTRRKGTVEPSVSETPIVKTEASA